MDDHDRRLSALERWQVDVANELRDWREAWPQVVKMISEREIDKRVARELTHRDAQIVEARRQTQELQEQRWKPWQRRLAVVGAIVTVAASVAQALHSV